MSHGTHKNKQVTSQTWSQQSHGDSLLVTPRARHRQVRKTKFLKSQLYSDNVYSIYECADFRGFLPDRTRVRRHLRESARL